MASLEDFLDDISDDQESDVNPSPQSLFDQPRIFTLSTFVTVPGFDPPMSEGDEQNMPEVDMINSLVQHPSTAERLPQLKPKKIASNLLQRRLRAAPRQNIIYYDSSPDPLTSLDSRSPRTIPQDDPQRRPAKRLKINHTVGLDAQSRNHDLLPRLPAQPATSSSRKTRSSGHIAHQQLHPSRRRNQRRNVLAEPLNAAPQESLPDIQPLLEEASHSDLGPELSVKDASSLQAPSRKIGTKICPASPQAVVQERDTIQKSPTRSMLPPSEQRQTTPTHSLDCEVPLVSQADDAPPTATEGTQREQSPDDGLFMNPESVPRASQTAAEIQEQERRVEELCKEYGSDDDKDCNNGVKISGDIHIPEELGEALDFAHYLNEAANSDRLPEEFDDINILKGYSRLKRTIGRWKFANDYSKTGDSIKLSTGVLKEAKAMLEKPNWHRETGLIHIFKRVLPSLVRMLYVSLVYYLSEAGTIKRLSYEPLKGCRNITKGIIKISEKAYLNKPEKFRRPGAAVGMIARIKKVHKIIERRLTSLMLVKDAAENAQRQQARERQQAAKFEEEAEYTRRLETQRERQQAAEIEREAEYAQTQQTQRERKQAAELEEENELRIRKWKEHWRVLHDQRFGAELEGQFCLSIDKERHLRHIPLENAWVKYPCWDEKTQVYALAEGLQKFTGPDVYRKIFRRYCCRGGPLQDFNVSEIVDKAVSLRDSLMMVAVEDGEDQERWVIDIPDPRKPPVALR